MAVLSANMPVIASRHRIESAPGTSIDDLVDQLTVPDYANPHDQIARTKVFLLIYRKFMRPRELLEMLIARFEALGEYVPVDVPDAVEMTMEETEKQGQQQQQQQQQHQEQEDIELEANHTRFRRRGKMRSEDVS
ncbi:hypothetical protein EDD11_000798 [Mortierella claussenii]|nr:hypothetical protein EDD11_000798 [Mortierella claussenii]